MSTNWMHPHIGHCDLHGVDCNLSNNTIKLELLSNGLSGTLTPNISKLSWLKVLDLNNNNIKVMCTMSLHVTYLLLLLYHD